MVHTRVRSLILPDHALDVRHLIAARSLVPSGARPIIAKAHNSIRALQRCRAEWAAIERRVGAEEGRWRRINTRRIYRSAHEKKAQAQHAARCMCGQRADLILEGERAVSLSCGLPGWPGGVLVPGGAYPGVAIIHRPRGACPGTLNTTPGKCTLASDTWPRRHDTWHLAPDTWHLTPIEMRAERIKNRRIPASTVRVPGRAPQWVIPTVKVALVVADALIAAFSFAGAFYFRQGGTVLGRTANGGLTWRASSLLPHLVRC